MAWIQIIVAGTIALSGILVERQKGVVGTGVMVSCGVDDVLAEAVGRAQADAWLMEFARFVMFKKDGRAARNLTLYLAGKTSEEEFPLAELLKEDEGVRTAFHKALSAPKVMTPVDPDLAPIKQSQYKVKDWWGALGSFSIYYRDLGIMDVNGKKTRVAVAYGVNVYRWHPNDARRISQCVHQAAARLAGQTDNQVPVAKEFDIYGTPTYVDITTGRPIAEMAVDPKFNAEMRRAMQKMKASEPSFIMR